ncbi:AI-2E family transporter [Aliiroseovarius sp. PTFE2010]|uniref:AI-2E family transporter n=1 Tax=Aliiroseovarius sp. PTFE2010 TaxID=3417190 RepID=UPI003CF49852
MQKVQTNWAVVGIFIILCVHTLHWAAGFLVPITAAFLGFLVTLPLESRLRRIGIPSSVTAASVCTALSGVILFVLFSISAPVAQLLEDLPDLVQSMRYDMASIGGEMVENLQEAQEAAEEVMGEEPSAVTVKVDTEGGILARLMATAPTLGGQIILSVVLMFFLISSGQTFLRKLVAIGGDFREKRATVEVVQRVSVKLGSYLSGITFINAGLGVVVGIAMWLLDVPDPVMFGFIAFSFNFVPYLGAVAGASLAAIVGYSDAGSLWSSAGIFAVYMVLTSIEGQLVTPYLLSGRLRLNPTLIFLTVAFFAWIWSVIGMVVAVPILIAAKIILDEHPATRPIGLFLGSDHEEQAT